VGHTSLIEDPNFQNFFAPPDSQGRGQVSSNELSFWINFIGEWLQ